MLVLREHKMMSARCSGNGLQKLRMLRIAIVIDIHMAGLRRRDIETIPFSVIQHLQRNTLPARAVVVDLLKTKILALGIPHRTPQRGL